jgi:HEAT repeat protein
VEYITSSPLDQLKKASLHAFSTKGSSDESAPVIEPRDAVPVLIRELKEGPPNGRHFAALVLRDIGPEAKSAIPVLVDVVRNDSDSRVRYSAFGAVAAVDKAGETTVSLLEELARGKDRRLAVSAVGTAAAYAPGGRMGSGTRSNRPGSAEPSELPEKLKPFVNMVIEAVTDTDPELRRAALQSLYEMGPVSKDAVPALTDVLEKGNPGDCDLVFSILDHLSPDAGKAALPALLKAEQAQRESGNGWLAERLLRAIRTIELGSPRFPGGTPSGGMRRGARGAAKGAAGYSGTKTPPTPAPPSGKPASEEKKTEAPR